MTRPTSKQKRIKQATELLQNETLAHIFDAREREIVERWKGCDSLEKREACYYEIRALIELRDTIYATATDTDA